MWIVLEGMLDEGWYTPDKVYTTEAAAWEEACVLACGVGGAELTPTGFTLRWGKYISVQYIEVCE